MVRYANAFDIAVATQHGSIDLLSWLTMANPDVMPAYYVQDYEPNFYPTSDSAHHHARESYTRIPGCVLFAKTDWIRETVAREHGIEVHKVTPSIDSRIYQSKAANEKTIDVCAMIRPGTPVRSPQLTAEILATLDGRKTAVFGCDADDPFWIDHSYDGEVLGVLRREQVADLLRRSKLFIDLSEYQAFGRTGLEAMACGCATILPEAGGVDEYAIDGSNCLRVDTSDREAILSAIHRLLDEDQLRSCMTTAGLETAAGFSIDCAAESVEKLFTGMLK